MQSSEENSKGLRVWAEQDAAWALTRHGPSWGQLASYSLNRETLGYREVEAGG